jgi:hypothetical protein
MKVLDRPSIIPIVNIRRLAPRLNRGQPVTLGDVAAFLIGLAAFIEFQVGGKLFATDVLLLVVFLYLAAKRGSRLLSGRPRRVLIFALLWLVGQIVTDIFRQSSAQDFLRGWANISLLTINFAALYLLLRTDRRIVLYATGFALSRIVKYFLNPDPGVGDDPWKWGLAFPVTMFLVLISTAAYRRRELFVTQAALVVATVLNLHYNFRSMALFTFATLCCLLLAKREKARKSPLQVAAMVLGLAACGWGFQMLYEYEAASGALGQEAFEKYELQSAGRLGIILGGRSESLASIRAILDSPILGHGSWARDPYYVDVLESARVENGYKPRVVKDDLIPAHSHVLGAWVDAGVLGAVFWCAVLWLTLRGMKDLLFYALPLRVLSLFCGFSFLWDIPFSPFAAERRFVTPVYMLLMILAISRARRRRDQEFREKRGSQRRVRQPNPRRSGYHS